VAVIDSADTSLIVMMYSLSQTSVNALAAAAGRGVDVRVMLDPTRPATPAPSAPAAGGAQVKNAAQLENYHASSCRRRRPGHRHVRQPELLHHQQRAQLRVILRDADDLADIATIFDMDWSGTTTGYLRALRADRRPTRAPVDRPHQPAQTSLDLAIMYRPTPTFSSRSSAAGVAVRAAGRPELDRRQHRHRRRARGRRASRSSSSTPTACMPSWSSPTASPFVGSQNSVDLARARNRELGVLVADDAPMARITGQFATDWANGFE
jgi:phosphatidylserine/phosphatidylglycerophosphate/cardiolipin synthase-like enzyme